VNEQTDVVVVGGGPCGSFAALTAAKLGAAVVVFEEHSEIGVPPHCAGLLSISGLKRASLRLSEEVIENRIKGAVFYSPSCKELVISRDAPVSYVINRKLFDKHVAELATRSGVQFRLRSRVKSLSFDSHFVSGVVVKKKESDETVASRLVIDAEGCSSILLKRAGLITLDKRMVVNAIQAEVNRVDDIDLDTVEVYLGRKYAPGFFAWIIPRRDASAKVGLATKRGDPREYLRRFMKHHPVASKKLRKTKVNDTSLHPIPLGGMVPKAYSNGLLVVGDAASQVKPTTGGGVVFGLLCSKIAGEVASEALKENDLSEASLSRYQNRCRDLIGSELAMMRRVRRLLNRLSDEKVDKAIELCRRLEVNRLLEESGDMDYQGQSLMRILRHPTALIAAVYLMLSSLTS